MRIEVAALALTAWLAAAGFAHAQLPACKTDGDARARVYSAGADMSAQMMVSLGVTASLDEKVLVKVDPKAACQRARFTFGKDAYVLTGENGEDIPRKAVTERADAPIAFLAPYLDLGALVNKGASAPADSAHFALVVADANSAKAVRLYTALPADAVLAREMELALRGGLSPIAVLDRATKHLNVYVQTQPRQGQAPASPREAPPGLTPRPGTGPGQPFTSAIPDGVIFADTPEGGAAHKASGFTCPAKVAGRARVRLTVYDPSENGRDVSCGYGSSADPSWYTVYLTHLPGMSAGKVFDIFEKDAKTAAPPKGRFEAPLKADRDPPAPRYASFWKNERGGVDGLWLVQVGDWHIKVRATFRTEDQAEAKAFAEEIYRAVFEQLKAPAV